jgi:hypothetical protein
MVLNPMAYVDEVVLLKAMHTDTDELSIKCENTICDLLPEVDYPLEDPLALTWDDQGAGGTFPLGNTGRCVVYVPPQKDDVSIRCVPQDLIVRDPDARKTENQPVARVAIDLTKCDRDWLPEKDNSTTFTARIYEYRYGRCTYPGPARRITFELTEVSAEQGYCVNRGPSWENDLLFSQALLDGSFHLCIGTASSSRPPYFTQATTRTRGTEAIVTVSSEDYGSYGEMASSAFNARALSPREPGGDVVCQVDRNSVDIPRDDIPQDGNHIADKWDLLYPGDDGETADQDASVNNAQRGDGLTRYEEYRGVDVDDSTVITYNPARTTQQELADPQNERLSPYQKDLFVTSYDEADFAQLLYGRAYEEAWIMVHKFTGSDRRGIDVLQVDVTAGTPPNAFFTTPLETDRDGHLNKLHTPTTERDWRADWLGGSYTDSQSGEYAMPLVFDKCIDAYFHEKSYVDGTTLANFGAAPADWEWSGAPNGQLDNQVAVEDRNDNGSLQSWEDDDTSSGGWNFPDNGDGGLDGDYLGTAVRALAFISRAWTGDLSVFDFDNDGRVELGANDYTLARVTLHVLTHEMGHALGIRAHCQDSTCLMYEATLNWDRQDHLCPRCQGLLRIHND